MLKGSFDFLAVNHYSSDFIQYSDEIGNDWSTDGRFKKGPTNINGDIIGPDVGIANYYPLGLRKLINWVDKRYGH